MYSAIFGTPKVGTGGAVAPSISDSFWGYVSSAKKGIGDVFEPLSTAFTGGDTPYVELTDLAPRAPVIEPEFPTLPKVTDDIMGEFDTGIHGFIDGEFDVVDVPDFDIPGGFQPPITEVADDLRGINTAAAQARAMELNAGLRESLESIIGGRIDPILTGYERLAAARTAPIGEDFVGILYAITLLCFSRFIYSFISS